MPDLDDFAGDWRIARVIEDARAGATSRFDGRAAFVPNGDALRYRETGTLTLPDGSRLSAERSYIWRRAGAGIAVEFADGRPFHAIAPGSGEAAHWCDPDDYRVAYDFTGWPLWRATWRVRGPRKDYVMRSTFAPAA